MASKLSSSRKRHNDCISNNTPNENRSTIYSSDEEIPQPKVKKISVESGDQELVR